MSTADDRAFWYSESNETRLHSLPVAQLCVALTRKGQYFKGGAMDPGRWLEQKCTQWIYTLLIKIGKWTF